MDEITLDVYTDINIQAAAAPKTKLKQLKLIASGPASKQPNHHQQNINT